MTTDKMISLIEKQLERPDYGERIKFGIFRRSDWEVFVSKGTNGVSIHRSTLREALSEMIKLLDKRER